MAISWFVRGTFLTGTCWALTRKNLQVPSIRVKPLQQGPVCSAPHSGPSSADGPSPLRPPTGDQRIVPSPAGAPRQRASHHEAHRPLLRNPYMAQPHPPLTPPSRNRPFEVRSAHLGGEAARPPGNSARGRGSGRPGRARGRRRARVVTTFATPAPFTPPAPPRARADRRRGGPAAQKGGWRISFTPRPAPLQSRSGGMTPFLVSAGAAEHPKVMRRPPFPAPSTPRTVAAGAAGRALRVRARSIAAAGTSTGVARPDEAEKTAPAEPARGGIWRSGRIVRASTPDALGDFRMIPRLRRRCGGVRGGTILPEHQNRDSMGAAERPNALGSGDGAPARPREPIPTTARPRTPPDTPDEPPTTPRTRSNRLRQRSGQHRRSSSPTTPPTTGARTRVCYASFRLLRPSTLHCTRKEGVVEGEGAQQTERSAAEGEAGAAGGEAGAAADNRMHRIACSFRRSRVSFPPVSARGAAGLA